MQNKKGVTELVLILVVVVVLGVAAFIAVRYFDFTGSMNKTVDTDIAVVSPSPISDSTDVDVLEEEFEATLTGSVDSEIEEMMEEAASL